jgi:O-antigen/teichoic acid export membrane protein
VLLTGRVRALVGTSAGIAVAMMVMNVATYGYTILVAHVIGPRSYGEFIAVMNTLMVVGVASFGLQATAARRISAAPGHVGQIEAAIMRVTYRAAVGLGLLLLALAPVIDRLLRLDSLATAALVAFSAVPLTVMGGQAGTLQGERRWAALAAVYIAAGVPRLVLGTALVTWRPNEVWALVGVAIGFCAPVVVGWWALRHQREPGARSHEHRSLAILRESLHNSQALFAYFALTNVDILVARNVLSDHDSGLYAAGLILTKALMFLPQIVVVVAFPSLVTAQKRRRALLRSSGLVALLGAVGTLAAWLLADLAMVFVGGEQFTEIRDNLWVFAVLGTVLSLVQLLVYAVLARQGRRSVSFVWLALVSVVVGGLTTTTLTGLVSVVIVVDGVLLLVLVAVSGHLMRQPVPEQQVDALM